MSECAVEELLDPIEFSSHQHQEGSPETLGRLTPDVSVVRKFFNREFRFPDGLDLEIWTFEDASGARGFPAPLTRAREDQVVHVKLEPGKKVHTIHHHGIEPEPRNDGVAHTSFEVTGSYTYQWRPEPGIAGDPNTGSAGTYFYHCHVNTVLHVQMGMFGPIVIDPKQQGRGTAFVDGPRYDLESETLWVPYSVDPRWHTLNHAAGLQGEDVGLNRFEPTNFYVLGDNLDHPDTGDGVKANVDVTVHLDRVATTPTLVRIVNANYFPLTIDFRDLDVEVISHDGRPFRDLSGGPGSFCRPVRVATRRLHFGAAERYEVLLKPTRRGTFPVDFTWLHWIRERPIRTLTRTVTVV